MKKNTLKKIIGILIIAIVITGSFIVFKRLPPVPKLILLAIDVTIWYAVINYLINPKKSR